MASSLLAVVFAAILNIVRILGLLVRRVPDPRLIVLTDWLLQTALFVSFRLLTHPLRNFPGPFLARFTHAYGAFLVWRRCSHLTSIQLHKKYGPVVRIAPDRLIFNSATAVQDIYHNPRVTKGRAYVQLRQGGQGTPNLFNTLDKEEHRKKRRIIAPVISERSMRVFEPDMWQQLEAFLVQLLQSSQQNQFVNMTPRCERLGVDVVGKLAFGYSLNTQTEPIHRVIVEGIKTRSNRSSLYFFWSFLRVFEPVFDWFEGRHDLDGFYRSVKTMIEARMSTPKESIHDFYALASGDIAPGEPGLISKDLWAEAVFFIAAGGSTTSTAMSGIFFYLSRYPDAYARLASEIRTTFFSGRDIRQGPQLSSCKYLRAVIEETMRMSPSTLAPGWREQDPASVAAGEPFIVDGHVIPPGTQVGVSTYALQHDASYFPDPYEFRPERWLPTNDNTPESDSEKDARVLMRRSFVPFSIGDRSCAGKAMAYLEMSLTVARTLWYFDFQKAPGNAGMLGGGRPGRSDGRGRRDEFQLYDSIVVDHDGPNLVFTPRGDFWKELEI
ncbi:cytochrome P450 [Massariosphaeria phaeospora]|uniref:Cytochrome P450 n=1 Tax=Massariosphaeria phaeospora TaxID=100035 RepID=A0A7C8M5Y3_9PLEO|nr:cytochrome P450 [Massariosphaeria phaeospora]